jgi:ATP-binding cassette subfamily B protein IrtA
MSKPCTFSWLIVPPVCARAYVASVISFIALWILDWRLALSACAVLVVGFGILGLAMYKSIGLVDEYNVAHEQAMPVVRTFDTGNATFSRYQRALSIIWR